MENSFEDMDILSAFGLTAKQTALLFSLQRSCALKDADDTKSEEKKCAKKKWIEKWSNIISDVLEKEKQPLIDQVDLIQEFKNELRVSTSKTWFHLIILESVTFRAYSPLGDEEEDKSYRGLKWQGQTEYIKSFIMLVGYGKPEIAELYLKMYRDAIRKATGIMQKIIINTMLVLLVGALGAVVAGVFAGSIAVYLIGTAFEGLYGAALVSACLAFLGGGAIAAGGAGMAGGVMVIVGGGGLLGAATGAAAVAGKEFLFGNSPGIALTFAAKLDVVLREIILNDQRDIKLAQKVINNFRETIVALKAQIEDLKLRNEKNEKQIKNLKKAVEYMERIFKGMKI